MNLLRPQKLSKGIILSLCIIVNLTIINQTNANGDCNDDKKLIEAKYLIASYQVEITANNKKPVLSEIVLARKGNQVAYSKNGITEIWDLLKNKRIKLTKYFEQYSKGIEYQANEIKTHIGKLNWSSKYQLVPDDLINSMQVDKTDFRQCKKYQQLSKELVTKNGIDKLNINWLVDYQLPATINYRSYQKQVRWKLVKLEQARKKVEDYFYKRESYHLTDYADVGDNESDPFLKKMINLGFVSHSESVFFANRNGIKSTKQHYHQH